MTCDWSATRMYGVNQRGGVGRVIDIAGAMNGYHDIGVSDAVLSSGGIGVESVQMCKQSVDHRVADEVDPLGRYAFVAR